MKNLKSKLSILFALIMLISTCTFSITTFADDITGIEVSFAAGEHGTGTMTTVTKDSGSYNAPACGFEADGNYEFDKWSLSGSYDHMVEGNRQQDTITAQEVAVDGPVFTLNETNLGCKFVLTAVWKEKQAQNVTVQYDANGGGGSKDSDSVAVGAKITLAEDWFTAPNGKYLFGYYVAGTGYDDVYGIGAEINANSDLIITAQWADYVKVIFDPNGGTGNMDPVNVKQNSSYNLPENGFTAPANKEFDGWDAGDPGDPIDIVDSDVTVKATWTDILYEITFDANGGTGDMQAAEVVSGSEYELPDNGFTAPENKVFDKWDAGNPGDKITVDGNKTIKAVWKDKVVKATVSFDPNGGSGEMDAVEIDHGEYTLPANGFTAPQGKMFDKWDLGAAGDKVTIAQDTVLKAQWKDIPVETCTITFDANGGTGTMAPIQVAKGSKYKLPSSAFTAPAGKEFSAWDLGAVGTEITVDSNRTVKAIWKEIVYTVTYDGNGGAGAAKSQQVKYGEKLTLPENWYVAPTGKQFDAWSVGKPGMPIAVNQNMTIKATWKDIPVEYTVSKGADQRWTKYSNTSMGFSVTRNIDNATAANHFYKIQIDGIDIQRNAYVLSTGTADFGFGYQFLETLQLGKHTIRFVFDDGEVSCEFWVVNRDVGKTGDNDHIGIWVAVIAVCVLGAAVAFVCLRKKQEPDNNNPNPPSQDPKGDKAENKAEPEVKAEEPKAEPEVKAEAPEEKQKAKSRRKKEVKPKEQSEEPADKPAAEEPAPEVKDSGEADKAE